MDAQKLLKALTEKEQIIYNQGVEINRLTYELNNRANPINVDTNALLKFQEENNQLKNQIINLENSLHCLENENKRLKDENAKNTQLLKELKKEEKKNPPEKKPKINQSVNINNFKKKT